MFRKILIVALIFSAIFLFISNKPPKKIEKVKTFEVDDFPVTDEMIGERYHFLKNKKDWYVKGQVWFMNKKLGQTIIFDLYTDFWRYGTYLFGNEFIPIEAKKVIGLQWLYSAGDDVDKKERDEYLKKYYNLTKEIPISYFKTKKGFKLGSKKEKALKVYGKPDKVTKQDGYEKLEWDFVGHEMYLYDGKKDKKGRPHAKDVWGYHVKMYFKNNKLSALIIYNDPP